MNTPNSGGVSPILEMEVCNLPCARSLILSHVPKLSGSQDLGVDRGVRIYLSIPLSLFME